MLALPTHISKQAGCRFYQGRRTDDDERQIGRWKGVAGLKGRWKRSLVNKVRFGCGIWLWSKHAC